MAEIEIHTGHHAPGEDPVSRSVGFQVGLIGILLAVATIAAHRQHTDAEECEPYAQGAEESRHLAEAEEAHTARAESLALRFDLGEGFLELGLVLSSLFFLGRQRLYYQAGRAFAAGGVVIALSALLV